MLISIQVDKLKILMLDLFFLSIFILTLHSQAFKANYKTN